MPNLAQDRSSTAGKILRLTDEGEIPPSNPWPGSPVWIDGVRNTQGFDWLDPETLLITDHGPTGDLGRDGHDELNVAKAGANLGWPNTWQCEQSPGVTAPLLVWEEALPPGGASMYTGSKIPEWKNNLVIASLGSKHLQRVILDTTQTPIKVISHETYFLGEPPEGFGRLREVIMGPDGDLYVTTSNCDSRGFCPVNKDKILRLTK
jgi:glucose/arabinose dehydrogenase